jgi:hypothetical protein
MSDQNQGGGYPPQQPGQSGWGTPPPAPQQQWEAQQPPQQPPQQQWEAQQPPQQPPQQQWAGQQPPQQQWAAQQPPQQPPQQQWGAQQPPQQPPQQQWGAPPPPQQQWGAPQGWQQSTPPAPKRGSMMPVLIVGAIVVAAVAAGGYYLTTQKNSSPSPAPTATVQPSLAIKSASPTATPVVTIEPSPTDEPTVVETATPVDTGGPGTLVFTDDFTDSSSGWSTETLASGTSFAYGSGGFLVTAVGDLNHFDDSPWTTAYDQLAMAATGTQAGNITTNTGLGVACFRGSGSSQLFYEFMLYSDGGWTVERGLGPFGSAKYKVIKEGSGAPKPGSTPVTVQAACMKVDAKTVRLILAVNDKTVADVTDAPGSIPSDGWTASIDVCSVAADTSSDPLLVTYTKFQEWNMSQ